MVNVAAAYWGDEWHVAVGAGPCRARLLTGSQLGLESKRPSREELARALEAVRTLPEGVSKNEFVWIARETVV